MSPLLISLLGFIGLFVLIALHVPIGIAMALTGVVGFAMFVGWEPALSLLASEPASTMSNLDLAVIPLFMLMGSLATAAGMAGDIYATAQALIGHRRGGLAATTVVASAGFGAISGSGVATTATFGRVALPEMLERGYAPSVAAGSVAAGGTLGIIVPPSGIMILYAVLTEQSVLNLFTAALVPAALSVLLYLAAIRVTAMMNPALAPGTEKLPWRVRVRALGRAWRVAVLAVLVMGGIYSGIFTVNEAASIGVVVAFVFAVASRRMNLRAFLHVLAEASATTAMIYIMVFGATIFSYFVTVSGASTHMIGWINGLGLPPLGVIFALLVLYVLLGAVFDEVASMVITLPLVVPIILSFGYDLVWWGIVNIAVVGIGMITPPIGINVMLLGSLRRDIRLRTIYRGILPFLCADLVRLALLVLFPMITLWLPGIL